MVDELAEARRVAGGHCINGHHDIDACLAIDRIERPPRCLELSTVGGVIHAHALPGDENPAGTKQRKGELGKLRQWSDCPRSHGRPATPIGAAGRERFRADRLSRRVVTQADGVDHGGEEPDLLADRVDEQGPVGRQRRRQRDAREPAAAAQIDEPVDAPTVEDGEPGQTVDDMTDGDRCGLANRRQVDRLVPYQEQADVPVDRGPRIARQLDSERLQGSVEGVRIGRGQSRTEIDARRERVPRTVQAPLLSVVPARARAPLPAWSFVTPPSAPGFPWLVRFAAGFPRAPREPRYPRWVRCGCWTLGGPADGVNTVIHEST